MKNRLPRKRKKQVKKLVAKSNAIKTAMTAVAMAQNMARIAMIAATPFTSSTLKALSVAEVGINSINVLKQFSPVSWKTFIKQKI
jgi:hypothetical protein